MCVRACMCTCVRACVRACICVCVFNEEGVCGSAVFVYFSFSLLSHKMTRCSKYSHECM